MTAMHDRTFPCPRCGEPVRWNAESRWKPFCSERCKLIDLGAWFAEEHVIPEEIPPFPDSGKNDGNEDQ